MQTWERAENRDLRLFTLGSPGLLPGKSMDGEA